MGYDPRQRAADTAHERPSWPPPLSALEQPTLAARWLISFVDFSAYGEALTRLVYRQSGDPLPPGVEHLNVTVDGTGSGTLTMDFTDQSSVYAPLTITSTEG